MSLRPVCFLLAVALLAGCSGTAGGSTASGARTGGVGAVTTNSPSTSPSTSPGSATPTPTPPPPPPQLPRGGRTILPNYRVVAYYGNGESRALGVLGHYPPDVATAKLAKQAAAYATTTRPVLPALELIVTVADGFPGADGDYSHDTSAAVIQRYLVAARKAKMLLVLDIQPGRSTFLPKVKQYEHFLLQPDVGLALDSEWRMAPGQVPAHVIGHVDASEINAVSAYLSRLTVSHNLPQKLLLLHHFTPRMIVRPTAVVPRRGLAIVWHCDGFGSRDAKLYDYRQLHVARPFFNGFKLFYTLDQRMFSPREILHLRPEVDFISYQ